MRIQSNEAMSGSNESVRSFTDYPEKDYPTPSTSELEKNIKKLIKTYQNLGSVATFCTRCVNKRELSVVKRSNSADGYILRCAICHKEHYHRPEIFRGLTRSLASLHHHLYLECHELRLFQIQALLGITEDIAVEFRKRFHYLLIYGLVQIPIPRVGGSFDFPVQIDCFFPGRKRKSKF